MYDMIFKRKSFHIFSNVGDEKLTEVELQEIKLAYEEITPLYSDIKTDIRIVEADEKLLGRGAEYSIEIYSEKKDNYLMNVGFIGQMLDLYLVSKSIGTLWFGMGKPETKDYDGLSYVITILIKKVDSADKFRKDMFKSNRKSVDKIWSGQQIAGVSDIVRFAPSAGNTQPWRIKRDGDTLELYRYRKTGRVGIMPKNVVHNLNRLDIGIFICFLELTLKHEGFDFTKELFVDDGTDDELTLNAKYFLNRGRI